MLLVTHHRDDGEDSVGLRGTLGALMNTVADLNLGDDEANEVVAELFWLTFKHHRSIEEVKVILLDCPFCGGDASYITYSAAVGSVICNDCGGQTSRLSESEATIVWNRRDG